MNDELMNENTPARTHAHACIDIHKDKEINEERSWKVSVDTSLASCNAYKMQSKRNKGHGFSSSPLSCFDILLICETHTKHRFYVKGKVMQEKWIFLLKGTNVQAHELTLWVQSKKNKKEKKTKEHCIVDEKRSLTENIGTSHEYGKTNNSDEQKTLKWIWY